MEGGKTSFRERFNEAPAIKKWGWEKSLGIVTRSDLQNLLFNNSEPRAT